MQSSQLFRCAAGAVVVFIVTLLAACHSGSDSAVSSSGTSSTPTPPVTYTVSGTVTGLPAGQQVVLTDNGGDAQTISSDGNFTFPTPIAANGSYLVVVSTQPANAVCTVSNQSGSGMVANISNVAVTCSSDTYTIGGAVSGLASGQQVILLNNGADALTVGANVGFTFATPVAYNSSYAVTVGTQPVGQTCTVSNAGGNQVSANVNTVSVICSTDSYTIGGVVSGLNSGEQVTLFNNGADPQIVTANTSYVFSTPVAYGASFAVSVGTQPLTQTCTVSNPSGSNVTAAIANVNINCAAATETTLYGFGGVSGDPSVFVRPGLTLGSDGNFYGIGDSGGANGDGAIFKLTPAGVETVLYSFTGGNDGSGPAGPLVQGSDGNFYGVTTDSGAYNNGTVFKITPTGTLTTIYAFGTNSNDGANPYAGLTLVNGVFYGVTGNGGAAGYGTVFSITPDGNELVLYSFTGGTGGFSPSAALLMASDGYLYGTTEMGGANSNGTLFRVTTAGSFTKLHDFGSSGDVVNPFYAQLLQASDGNLYAVAEGGGANNNGGLYEVTLSANSSPSYSLVYSFGSASTDVTGATSTLVQGTDGELYGTSLLGGANGAGTIYKISTTGNLTILYSFAGGTADGGNPSAGPLVLGTDGYFYGLTGMEFVSSGPYGSGTFFRY